MGRKLMVVGLALAMTASVAVAEIREAPPAGAEPHSRGESSDGHTIWNDLGYGSLAVITNVFYMPVKLVYSVLGLPVGGLAYVFTAGDSSISDEIWRQSLGGDYVVTPKMLSGADTIQFNGRPKD